MDFAFMVASIVVYLLAGIALIGFNLMKRKQDRNFQYLLRNRKGRSLADLQNAPPRFN